MENTHENYSKLFNFHVLTRTHNTKKANEERKIEEELRAFEFWNNKNEMYWCSQRFKMSVYSTILLATHYYYNVLIIIFLFFFLFWKTQQFYCYYFNGSKESPCVHTFIQARQLQKNVNNNLFDEAPKSTNINTLTHFYFMSIEWIYAIMTVFSFIWTCFYEHLELFSSLSLAIILRLLCYALDNIT